MCICCICSLCCLCCLCLSVVSVLFVVCVVCVVCEYSAFWFSFLDRWCGRGTASSFWRITSGASHGAVRAILLAYWKYRLIDSFPLFSVLCFSKTIFSSLRSPLLQVHARGFSYVLMIHVGGARCVTSTTDHPMKIQTRITLSVDCILLNVYCWMYTGMYLYIFSCTCKYNDEDDQY